LYCINHGHLAVASYALWSQYSQVCRPHFIDLSGGLVVHLF